MLQLNNVEQTHSYITKVISWIYDACQYVPFVFVNNWNVKKVHNKVLENNIIKKQSDIPAFLNPFRMLTVSGLLMKQSETGVNTIVDKQRLTGVTMSCFSSEID